MDSRVSVCNFLKARGRARAPNSICSVLAKANSKEMVRERLNETLEALMKRAIAWVQQMPQREYQLKVKRPPRKGGVNAHERSYLKASHVKKKSSMYVHIKLVWQGEQDWDSSP